jgi:FG-GAP-like repeat
LNNGRGRLRDATREWLPQSIGANGFDLTTRDFDGDGKLDVFIASRGGPDRLLLTRQSE